MFAFYRGTTAYFYKLLVQHGARFLLYENLISAGGNKDPTPMQTVAAATASALFTTLLAYPLDLAHGRMAADMSKKPALGADQRTPMAGKTNRRTLLMQ